VRKRKGKGQEKKIESGQLMRMLQGKALYIFVPNPQDNLFPRLVFSKVDANSGSLQPKEKTDLMVKNAFLE